MKLRIRGNSIRLRLGQSEVHQLAVEGAIHEVAYFGAQPTERLTYTLRASGEGSQVAATLEPGQITVSVACHLIHEWATTERVGIEMIQRIAGSPDLRILIEKDFECIDAPLQESQEDAFPRPLQSDSCVTTASG